MPKAVKECDPAIKAIIMKIDEEQHNYIMEDLDDQHLMIKENQLNSLKKRLEESTDALTDCKELANTQQMPDESGSD